VRTPQWAAGLCTEGQRVEGGGQQLRSATVRGRGTWLGGPAGSRARTHTAVQRGTACASDNSAQRRGLDDGKTAPGSSSSSSAATSGQQRDKTVGPARCSTRAAAAISDTRAPGNRARLSPRSKLGFARILKRPQNLTHLD
jgi:hypothetical protein